jgi:ABC-2 type transport system ATP-binding protein
MRFYGRLSGVSGKVIRELGGELLQMVGLDGWENKLVKQFSKGMRQRLCLAQALLHDPQLLIMDEPTDGLDPVGRAEMRQLIHSLKTQGKTVFLNSHILQEVELVCDRVAILAAGSVRGVGTLTELTDRFCTVADQRTCLELAGTVQQIQAAIDLCGQRLSEVVCHWLPSDRCRLTLSCRQQADVDELIDRLRQQSVSIRSLERKQQSLEEIFLTAIRS